MEGEERNGQTESDQCQVLQRAPQEILSLWLTLTINSPPNLSKGGESGKEMGNPIF